MTPRLLPSLPLLALVAAGMVASAAWSQTATEPSSASLTVTTDAVRRETIGIEIAGSGLVEAREEAAIGAPASGLALTEMLVVEGQRVEAGAVLAHLDDGLLSAEIAEQQAAIDSAEASHATALSSAERGRRLSKTGAVSAETVEERETTVKTTEAALAQAKAVLQTLDVQRQRTVVRAPFAGIVSAKPAALGIMVQTGTELLKLQRDGALRAVIDVPEQHLSRLAPGAAAVVTGPSGDTLSGTIAVIGATVDPATHLGRVEIALPEGSGLKAGMFVRAAIETGGTETMTVAESALTFRDGHPAVFVVSGDNAVTLTPVTPGERRNGRVAVEGALQEGARVATAGAGFLNEGNTVRVVTEQAATDAAPQTEIRP